MNLKTVDTEGYIQELLGAIRPGGEKVQAYYEHRVGVICKDPKLMLMPWDDHLVHRGDGVFEAMKFVGRKLYQLRPHLRRMQSSCKAIHLAPPCGWNEIEEIIVEVCRAADQPDGMVKVMVGRGPGGFGVDPQECPVASLYVAVYTMPRKREGFYEKGVTAFRTTIPAKQPYLAKIKSIDYLPNVLMKREAREKGHDYPFCFDTHNFLAEGAAENVMIVDQEGKLHVPQFTNCLAGTTLIRAVELMDREMQVEFRPISEAEIYDAREVIIAGTSIDAVSVVRYNGKPIHDVRPGPVSRRMRELLRQDIEENGLDV